MTNDEYKGLLVVLWHGAENYLLHCERTWLKQGYRLLIAQVKNEGCRVRIRRTKRLATELCRTRIVGDVVLNWWQISDRRRLMLAVEQQLGKGVREEIEY